MLKRLVTGNMDRRQVIAGSAAALAISGMPAGTAFAAIKDGTKRRGRRNIEPTLAKYLCESVHQPMRHRLDAVIADPKIDWEGTETELKQAHCPGCGEKIHPAFEHLAVVMPGSRAISV